MEPTIKVLVEVENERTREIKGTSKAGKPYRFYRQEVLVFAGGKYPQRVERITDEPHEALKVGRYLATKIYVGQRGVSLDLRDLVPGKAAAA